MSGHDDGESETLVEGGEMMQNHSVDRAKIHIINLMESKKKWCVCGNRICVFGVYGNGALSQSNRKLFTIMLFTHSHTFGGINGCRTEKWICFS